MSCFNKIKRALEKGVGVKVCKVDKNKIIILKNDEVLTIYDLKFVEYGNNINGFLDYWQSKLKISKRK